MRTFAAATFIALFSSGVSAAEWRLVGHDPFSPGIEIYLEMETLELMETDTYYVVKLTVHPVEQWGIESEDGSLDRRYPHRSMLEVKIYDCARTMDAVGQRVYFKGTRPVRGEEVLRIVEDDTNLYPPMFHDPVYQEIC